MSLTSIRFYLANCFLLTIPVLIWDILLTDKLPGAYQPAAFWHDIPAWLSYGENSARTLIFVLTLLMPIRIASVTQKRGIWVYVAGLLLYFASWLPLIYYPTSSWSHSLLGFMAPAYTPLVWLIGIGLIGNSFYVNIQFRRRYFLVLSILFVVLHTVHTYLIYNRLHG